MHLERAVIEGKFDIIDRNLRFLEEIRTLSLDKFVKSYKDIQEFEKEIVNFIKEE